MQYYDVVDGKLVETEDETHLYTREISGESLDAIDIDTDRFIGDLDDARALGLIIECVCKKEEGKCVETRKQHCHKNNKSTCLDGIKANCKP